jgi:penicillin-binding protein 2
MRRAIAVSSDVYFYTIGGGFESQKGLGIAKLDEYARSFGLGALAGIPLLGEAAGVIPTPEWKAEVFGEDEPWRLGDTYITAIGQFGFQITPLQAARYAAAIANGGNLMEPQLVKDTSPAFSRVGISDEHLQVVREGMRASVADGGTAAALNMGGISISGKTGTAEIGDRKQFMNSWVIGFWPSDNPRYAFATVLERAPAGTLSGASPAMAGFFEWLTVSKPEYVDGR